MCEWKLLRLSFAILLVFTAISPLSPQQPIVKVLYYNRMPFYGNLDNGNEGFLQKITRLILDDADISYSFEKVPINRILSTLNAYQFQCIAGAFRTEEREKNFTFSRYPIYQDSSPHYITRKSNMNSFNELSQISELLQSKNTLGVVENFSYGTWIDSSISAYKPKMVIVNTGDDQTRFFKMLQLRRFDYCFSSLEEANYVIKLNSEYQDSFSVRQLKDSPAGNIRWIMFSKLFPEKLLDKINQSILRVKGGQQYQSIINSITK